MLNILFRLREYDDAFRELFGRAMRTHAEEAYPFLKEIPTEPRPDIHTTQVTLPSGELLKNEPFEMNVPFRFNLSAVPYPPIGDADRPAYEAFIARKRKEYDARRRRRTLS